MWSPDIWTCRGMAMELCWLCCSCSDVVYWLDEPAVVFKGRRWSMGGIVVGFPLGFMEGRVFKRLRSTCNNLPRALSLLWTIGCLSLSAPICLFQVLGAGLWLLTFAFKHPYWETLFTLAFTHTDFTASVAMQYILYCIQYCIFTVIQIVIRMWLYSYK